MKKAAFIAVLVLAMLSSVVAGTLARYSTAIDGLAENGVVAKEFILLEEGRDTFQTDVNIAPSETVAWQFAVRNFNAGAVSQLAMDLDFTIGVTAAKGKQAIEPLIVTIKDQADAVVGNRTGTGTITFPSSFPLQSAGQIQTYTVEVEWPSGNAVDINYSGDGFGTTINVLVTGTEIPDSSGIF